jgi:hypothetical protein
MLANVHTSDLANGFLKEQFEQNEQKSWYNPNVNKLHHHCENLTAYTAYVIVFILVLLISLSLPYNQ